MPTIQAAGLATNYEQIGSGPLLVLLHGWANTWEAWLPLIPLLSDHYTLITPDLPGCGRTQTPDVGWTTAHYALWLQDFLQKLSTYLPDRQALNSQLPTFSLVGHSYGGKILLEYCSGPYEPQPKKIVLMDASGIPNTLNTSQKALRSLAKVTPNFLKTRIAASLRKKIYDEFGADSDYVTANEFQKKTLQIILSEDYTDKLASIAQKTLILWGKDDTSTPLWQGEILQTLIPLNKLVVYDASHFPHHDHPKQISDEVLHFLHL